MAVIDVLDRAQAWLQAADERGGNVNGRDTYVDDAVQLAWELWQDVADGRVTIEPDAMT